MDNSKASLGSMWTTPLMDAIINHEHCSTICSLIDSGHKPAEKHHNGATAFHVLVARAALENNMSGYYLKILEIILSKSRGACPKNDFQQSPIELGVIVDVPVDILSRIICTWSKYLKLGAVYFYFQECAVSYISNKQLHDVLVKGGSIYPVRCDLTTKREITYKILIRVLRADCKKASKLLKLLLKAGLDLHLIEQMPENFQRFIDDTIAMKKKNDIPAIVYNILHCGGRKLLCQLCAGYYSNKLSLPLHGIHKLKFSIYNKLINTLKEPFTLQDMVACVVRQKLRPNAILGLEKLNNMQEYRYHSELPVTISDLILLNDLQL